MPPPRSVARYSVRLARNKFFAEGTQQWNENLSANLVGLPDSLPSRLNPQRFSFIASRHRHGLRREPALGRRAV